MVTGISLTGVIADGNVDVVPSQITIGGDTMKALAFTSQQMEWLYSDGNQLSAPIIQLRALLLNEIMQRAARGYDTCFCIAERGADIIFGDMVMWVKATTHPTLRLICVIPHEGQATAWSDEWRDRYFKLVDRADDMVLMSHRNTHDCYQKSYRYMVDNATALLAVYDGRQPGDSAYTVEYARSKGREVVLIDPETQKRRDIPPRFEAL
jgi:uncharacterized phage-like protein YoqJ